MTANHERVRMADGTWLSTTLRARAEERAPRIVLVHSLALDRYVWERVAERLSDTCTVLTYDCRGHGRSDKPRGPYSAEQFAQDLCDVLNALGWESAAVAGCSMGGSVAMTFAGLHPERVSALTLVDTTAWYGPEALERWEERAQRAEREGLASLVEFQRSRWFTEAFLRSNDGVVSRCVRTFLDNDIQAYAATCRLLGALDARALLARVRMPTSIIVGEEDYATPPTMAEALHAAISGSSLTVMPKGRHLLPLERPETVADAIVALLQRTGYLRTVTDRANHR